MHLSLITSGLAPGILAGDRIIDEFIEYNDTAVRLTAPLGGVGNPINVSFLSFKSLIAGLFNCLPGVFGMIKRIGVFNTLKLLSPMEALWPSAPHTHVWEYPQQLVNIPRYFNHIYDLMSIAQPDTPAGALYFSIGKEVSAAEALGTTVQLMVNMTTANAIQSLIFRRCANPLLKPDDILKWDAPLQRNPRRATRETKIGEVEIPRGSLVLLMLGANNISCPAGSTLLTFGFGLHHCLGRHLVSMELKKVSEWLEDMDPGRQIKIEGDPVRLTSFDVGNWGFSSFRISVPSVNVQ
jgi:hypothetical protein